MNKRIIYLTIKFSNNALLKLDFLTFGLRGGTVVGVLQSISFLCIDSPKGHIFLDTFIFRVLHIDEHI